MQPHVRRPAHACNVQGGQHCLLAVHCSRIRTVAHPRRPLLQGEAAALSLQGAGCEVAVPIAPLVASPLHTLRGCIITMKDLGRAKRSRWAATCIVSPGAQPLLMLRPHHP